MARQTPRRLVWVFDIPIPSSTRQPWMACLERDGPTTTIYLSPRVPFEAVWLIWEQLTRAERLLWIKTPVLPPPPGSGDEHSQVATP